MPFPWGSPLSGVPDSAKIAWYSRTIEIPSAWQGERVFLVIGASDWHTTAWLDGQKLGEHRGGYTPFEFELTKLAQPGAAQRLTIRVDDADRAFKLEGKQGYGNARGIWQTPYLEARGTAALASLHFTPDIDAKKVTVEVRLLEPAAQDLTLRLSFRTGGRRERRAAHRARRSRRALRGRRSPTRACGRSGIRSSTSVEAQLAGAGLACRTSSRPTSACARSRS